MSEAGSRRLSVFATILMSLAALASSWASYQATLWSGRQAQGAAAAGALRTRATREATHAGQLRAIDVGVFVAWLGATTRGDTAFSGILERRFRVEFRRAFDAWMAAGSLRGLPTDSGTSATPFTLPEYRVAVDDSAARLERAADAASAKSNVANALGDGYVLDAVVFAMVLFFASTAQQSDHRRTQLVLLAVASLVYLVGLYQLITTPRG